MASGVKGLFFPLIPALCTWHMLTKVYRAFGKASMRKACNSARSAPNMGGRLQLALRASQGKAAASASLTEKQTIGQPRSGAKLGLIRLGPTVSDRIGSDRSPEATVGSLEFELGRV